MDHLCAHPPPLPPPFPPVRPDSRSASDGPPPPLLHQAVHHLSVTPSVRAQELYIAALQLLGQLSHCWAEPRQLRNRDKRQVKFIRKTVQYVRLRSLRVVVSHRRTRAHTRHTNDKTHTKRGSHTESSDRRPRLRRAPRCENARDPGSRVNTADTLEININKSILLDYYCT